MTCPVPEEQLPINQYLELKESWFFGWARQETKQFWQTNLKIWALCWVLSAPIANVSFRPSRYLGEFLLWSSIGATVCFLLILVRLYLGWWYVRNRLLSPQIVYEETGWYDGQIWQKSPADVVREKLLVEHEIAPQLRRLQFLFGWMIPWLGLAMLVWQIRDIL
ncbi:MAG: CGLD27 family protein [Pseudanabaenaceae cyanobacterium]